MKRWNLMHRWRKLGITNKLGIAFGVLLFLIVFVAFTGYSATTDVRDKTEDVILTSDQIQQHVSAMDVSLEETRRLATDFFWRYPTLDFEAASQTYSEQVNEQINEVVALSVELQQLISESDVSDALRESDVNLNFYLSGANRYADAFDGAVELIAELATPETGLMAQLDNNSASLQALLQLANDPNLLLPYLEMRSFEIDYFETRQRPLMQLALNRAFDLREEIGVSVALEEDQKAQALTYIDGYETTAAQILDLDVSINSRLNELDLEAEAIDPISDQLIVLAEAEVERARSEIDTAAGLATVALIVATLAAFLLAILVGLILNRSITRNVVKLTNTARELRANNMMARAQIDSEDEIGLLANTFNDMAGHINELVQKQEQKVVELINEIEQRVRAEESLQKVNRAYKTLSECNQAVIHARDETALLEELCQIIKEKAEYSMVWIGFAQNDEEKTVRSVAQAGFEEGYLDMASIVWSDTERGRGPTGTAIRTGRPIINRDTLTNPDFAPWREEALRHGYASSAAFPLGTNGQVIGALSVYAAEPDAFNEEETNLLTELAGDVAYGITALRTRVERERAQEALRESERKYRMLFDNAVMSITLWDVHNWQIMLLNTSGARNLGGTTSDEFIGKTLPDILLDPEMIKTTSERFKSIVDTGTGGQFEDFAELPNGEKRWFRSDIQPMRDESGKIFALQLISEDINERKQAEEEVRDWKNRYEAAVQASGHLLYDWNSETNEVTYGGNVSRILGYTVDEMDGGLNGWVELIHVDDRAFFSDVMAAIVNKREPAHLEYRVRTKDGRYITVEDEGYFIADAQGSTNRMIGFVKDITERKKAEEALRRSEEGYRRIADNATDVIWTMDMDLRLTYISPSITLLRGYSVEEALLQSVDVMMTPESLQIVMEAFEEGLELELANEPGAPRPVTLELEQYCKDGSIIWTQSQVTFLRGSDGEMAGMIGVTRDITERRQAEEASRASEEKFRTLVENSPAIICLVDRQARIQFTNRRLPEYEESEVIGRTVYDFVPPLFQDAMRERVQNVFSSGLADPLESNFFLEDGSEVWYETRFAPIRSKDKVVSFMSIITDITVRKKAETLLRESEEKYRLLADNTSDFVALTDLNAVITYVGPAHIKLGYSSEDLIGKPGLPFAHPEDVQGMVDALAKFYDRDLIATLVETGGRVPEAPVDYRMFDAWGNVHYLESVNNLIIDPNGENHQVLHISRDITERKLAEEKEREAEKLREVDRLRTKLLSNVSHELRTPLTTIKGYALMLLDYDERLDHDEKKQYLGIIDASSDRMNELVSNILEMSRLDAGMLRLDKRYTDVSQLVQDAAPDAQVRAPGHVIISRVSGELPRVNIDAKRIRQVMDNILDNATKYSDKGTTVVMRAEQADSELLISVVDQGIGIPADEVEKVFERMYRVDHHRTGRVGGAGLGLSICKGIVEAHGGRIWMDSEEGKGNTCTFSLPLQLEDNHDKQD
ncbi:MAG: PAS domain S-box protein [Chloroflexi bacterium]|nr:PAS domain S-box protein [Chloroflexota bacterium]